MDTDQTWPTEEELTEADNFKKLVKKIPKGFSEYQAAWIPDCDNGSDGNLSRGRKRDLDRAATGALQPGCV